MLEEANTTEAIARSESTPDLLTEALYAIEPRPGLIGVVDRLRRGDWLVEIFIIASIGIAGFLLISDGFFTTGIQTVGAARVPTANAVLETANAVLENKENPAVPHGPRVIAMVADGEKALDAGIGDGVRPLEHILNALKLASLQKSAAQKNAGAMAGITAHDATFVRGNGGIDRNSESVCADLNNFFQSGFVAAAKNTVLSHAPLGFISNPKMKGCAFSGEKAHSKNTSGENRSSESGDNRNSTQLSVLGVSVEIETSPQLPISGCKRSAVRYSLIMEIGPDREILSGRLRVEMPGVEIPIDDGSRDAVYRLGDDLGWVGNTTCASWLQGRARNGSLVSVTDNYNVSSGRRECGMPPRELLNQVADSVLEVLSK